MVVGNASGKRTLADAMDQDLAVKKKQREQSPTPKKPEGLTESRFFGAKPSIGTPNHEEELVAPIAGPSRVRNFLEDDKENVPMSDEDLDFIMDIPEDPVTQEDGYLSPTPSFSRLDTPELSSPLRPGVRRKRETDDGFDDFDAEALSSPEASRQAPRRHPRSIERLEWSRGKVLVRDTPLISGHSAGADETITKDGPDLRDILDDDMTSEIDCFDEDTLDPTPPITPDGSVQIEVAPGVDEDIDDLEHEELEAVSIVTRTEIVANGWWEKWGRTEKVKEEKFRVRL
jgi:exonuclease-1